ncbi:MAG: sulfur carrier protein ThiS [Granulosicoccaceae bacterium]|jgi:sulfur carrier protein
MHIILNGKPREIPDGCTVDKLVNDELHLAGCRLAMELNLEILPRSEFASRTLAEGDRVEIVHAIGGG